MTIRRCSSPRNQIANETCCSTVVLLFVSDKRCRRSSHRGIGYRCIPITPTKYGFFYLILNPSIKIELDIPFLDYDHCDPACSYKIKIRLLPSHPSPSLEWTSWYPTRSYLVDMMSVCRSHRLSHNWAITLFSTLWSSSRVLAKTLLKRPVMVKMIERSISLSYSYGHGLLFPGYSSRPLKL